jgi:hypothetical protein
MQTLLREAFSLTLPSLDLGPFYLREYPNIQSIGFDSHLTLFHIAEIFVWKFTTVIIFRFTWGGKVLFLWQLF